VGWILEMAEYGVADLPDGKVEFVGGGDEPLREAMLHLPENTLDAQASGEQASDDTVMKVGADPVVIGEGEAVACGLLDGAMGGHFPHDRDHQRALAVGHWAETDLDRELRPVCASRPKVKTQSHWTRLQRSAVGGPMITMGQAVPVWNQRIDPGTEQRLAVVAEHCLGRAVRDKNLATVVDDEDGVGSQLHDRPPEGLPEAGRHR